MNVFPVGSQCLDEFLKVARRVRGTDPLWIPPLTQPLLRDLSEYRATSAHLRQELFLCVLGGKPVGRIGAFLTPRLTGTDGRPLGQVGYFETIEDPDVAAALLDAACAWLADQGASEVWGPMAGGAHRAHRLMTAGFDRSPFLFEPRNPVYYPAFFERFGFRELHTWDSYDLPAVELCDALTGQWQVERKAARARSGFRLSFPVSADAPATLARLHDVLDEVWSGHVGYTPLDREEFNEVFGGVMAILPEGYLAVLEGLEGCDAGLAFMYPDYADAARRLDGDARGWGRWRGDPRPRRVILHTMALAPWARGSGALCLFLDNAVQKIRRDGYGEAVIALVDRQAGLRFTFARPTRTYALYARSLAGGTSPTTTMPLLPSM